MALALLDLVFRILRVGRLVGGNAPVSGWQWAIVAVGAIGVLIMFYQRLGEILAVLKDVLSALGAPPDH